MLMKKIKIKKIDRELIDVVIVLFLLQCKSGFFVFSASNNGNSEEYQCLNTTSGGHPTVTLMRLDDIYSNSFSLEERNIIESVDIFHYTCEAPYPIDVVSNFEENVHTHQVVFGFEIMRSFENFYNKSTYKFIAKARIKYKGNNGFKNFSVSCYSILHPECHSKTVKSGTGPQDLSVFIRFFDDPEYVKDLIVNDPSGNEVYGAQEAESSQVAPFCEYKLFYHLVHGDYNWPHMAMQCHLEDGAPGIIRYVYFCANPIACHNFNRNDRLEPSCVVNMDESMNETCKNCERRIMEHSLGFITCVPEGSRHYYDASLDGDEKMLFFFTSLPRPHRNATLYLDQDYATPGDMISLRLMNRNKSDSYQVTAGNQITILCNTSTYYFAHGSQIAIQYWDSPVLEFLKVAMTGPIDPSDHFGSVHEATLVVKSDSLYRIYCFAPIWNSFDWINKSIEIEVITDELIPISYEVAVAVSTTLILTALIFTVAFGICWIRMARRRYWRHSILTVREMKEFRNGAVGGAPLNFERLVTSYEDIYTKVSYNASYELKRDRLLLDETDILGKGHFGVVIKGLVKKKTGTVSVAVKTLKTKTNPAAVKALLSELKIMACVGKHSNIVNLIGACTKKMHRGEVYVAMEYCAHGNLQSYLRQNRDNFVNQVHNDMIVIENCNKSMSLSEEQSSTSDLLTTMDLMKWSWEISKGMEFLSSKKIVHGDLATRNILLTADNVAKVSDFGLSKQLVDYYYVQKDTAECMPWKWMSIESLRDMKFSVQSDVWSFGILLWEILTLAEIPYSGCNWGPEFVKNICSGYRLGKPEYATSEMYDLMRECWNTEPSVRPTFFAIKSFFEEILCQTSSQDYMKLDLTNESDDCGAKQRFLDLPDVVEEEEEEGEDDVFE